MAALLTWHHNCCHFHDEITPFSTPHHLSITARCNKTKIQDTILISVIGKVTHFYGDASTNYHTTVILLGVSHLVSASLFAARRWNTSNPTISHARSLVALLSTFVEPWSLNETAARRTDSINSWFSSISYRQHSTIRGEVPSLPTWMLSPRTARWFSYSKHHTCRGHWSPRACWCKRSLAMQRSTPAAQTVRLLVK